MGVRTLKVQNNDFVFENERLTQLTGLDALAQLVGNRLKLWLGEWFAIPENGIDYFGLFNQDKNIPVEKRLRIVYRSAILSDERVEKILTMEINFDNATREATIEFTAQTKEGVIEVSVTT